MIIHTTIDIKASAEDAWEVLGERFGVISEWASAITSSHLEGDLAVGAKRTCHIGGIGGIGPIELHENLVHFDRHNRRLAYEVASGLPKMIRYAVNRWAVVPVDPSRCRVTSDAKINVAWYVTPMVPLMRRRMAADIKKLCEELKLHIEALGANRTAA